MGTKNIKTIENRDKMTQTKKQSALEAVTNIVIGLITSFLIQLWIYPLLNIKVSINQNVFITFVFFVVSFVGSYALRRIFNNLSAANRKKSGKNGKGRGVLKQKGEGKSNVCGGFFSRVQVKS